jgi:hypothetical protein
LYYDTHISNIGFEMKGKVTVLDFFKNQASLNSSALEDVVVPGVATRLDVSFPITTLNPSSKCSLPSLPPNDK